MGMDIMKTPVSCDMAPGFMTIYPHTRIGTPKTSVCMAYCPEKTLVDPGPESLYRWISMIKKIKSALIQSAFGIGRYLAGLTLLF